VVNVMSRMWRSLPELVACACAAIALVAGVLVSLRDRGHVIFFVGDPFEEKGCKDRYPNSDAPGRSR